MNRLKELKKSVLNDMKKHPIKKDDSGRSEINLTIYDDDNFLSPYSSDNEEIISDEVASFLENNVHLINPKEPLHIKISSNEINETEKGIYKRAINNYYFNEVVEIDRSLKFNTLATVLLTLISLIIFVGLYFLMSYTSIPILPEVITVIAWVFLWEAVNQFFIERAFLRRRENRCLNLMSAKISFYALDFSTIKKQN